MINAFNVFSNNITANMIYNDGHLWKRGSPDPAVELSVPIISPDESLFTTKTFFFLVKVVHLILVSIFKHFSVMQI